MPTAWFGRKLRDYEFDKPPRSAGVPPASFSSNTPTHWFVCQRQNPSKLPQNQFFYLENSMDIRPFVFGIKSMSFAPGVCQLR